jgi:hypothetical protein
VPTTSAGLPRVSFFFFVAVAIYSTNKAYKAGGTCHSAVYIFLDVYDCKAGTINDKDTL